MSLEELYRRFLVKPIRLTLMTDSQTTLDSLRSVRPIIDKMNQHLLDNVKKCVDQEVVVVMLKRTGHKSGQKNQDHANMDNVMSSRPITF